MNVFGYSRVSTVGQVEEGYSLDEQKERIEAYCKGMGWNLLKVYTDAGESGAKADRPALLEMIQNIKSVDKVVVYKLDRLSRSQKDTLYLIEDVFLANGVDFVSMTENFDTSTPFGKAIVGILAVFAQLEREQIKERMSMGRVARAKSGRYVGQSRPPIGYRYVDGQLIVDNGEREQIVAIFDLVMRGWSFGRIAQELTDRGWKHQYGEWSRYTVRAVAANPVYTGKVSFNGIYYQGNHEAIVSEEILEKASAIADDRTHRFAHNTNVGKATSYLGGLLVCGKCGAMMYKYADDKGRYVCMNRGKGNTPVKCDNKRWVMADLDRLVFEEVKKLALDPPVKKEKKPVDHSKELARIDEQLSRLIDLYALGDIPLDSLKAKTAQLNERKLQLLRVNEKAQPDVAPLLRSFADILANGTFEDVRSVLFALIDHIEVTDEDVSIFWKFA